MLDGISQSFEPGFKRILRIEATLPREKYFYSPEIDMDMYHYLLHNDE